MTPLCASKRIDLSSCTRIPILGWFCLSAIIDRHLQVSAAPLRRNSYGMYVWSHGSNEVAPAPPGTVRVPAPEKCRPRRVLPDERPGLWGRGVLLDPGAEDRVFLLRLLIGNLTQDLDPRLGKKSVEVE